MTAIYCISRNSLYSSHNVWYGTCCALKQWLKLKYELQYSLVHSNSHLQRTLHTGLKYHCVHYTCFTALFGPQLQSTPLHLTVSPEKYCCLTQF